MRVAVVVPVFNAARFLAEALDSVLDQDLDGLQVVAVDDGSTDRTPKVLAGYGDAITVLRQDNRGPAAARNSGLGVCDAEFIAFLDADDVWPRGRLRLQLEYLGTRPGIDAVLGALQYLHHSQGKWQLRDGPFHAMSLSSGLFRRKVFAKIGVLDEALPYCEDVDWFFRARRHGVAIDRIGEVVLFYRRHERNLTNRMDLVRSYTLEVVARHRRQSRTLPS